MKLVDLFSGCGGFSLGAHRAGFSVPLAFDLDPILTSSYNYNFPSSKLVLTDIAKLSGAEIKKMIGSEVGGIFGGPPCQGFSSIGRREFDDPRRKLLFHFFRLVSEIMPPFFIMENVVGLSYEDAKFELDSAIGIVAKDYNILGPLIMDASDFGAATRRRRLFVIGIASEFSDAISTQDIDELRMPAQNVHSAISDLAGAKFVGDDEGFDIWRIKDRIKFGPYASNLRNREGIFSGNRKTVHAEHVIKRFSEVIPGGTDTIGRHVRLRWEGQCPTLRAGTGSDRGSFQSVRPLHPEEPRVITVREAARLQGFPDLFRFHPTIWHSFRMIGNSVSPVQSQALFVALRRKFEAAGHVI
ncbi:DNA cytosine methyltransferase [Pseudolysobacter antarcticus]|uniref:DNA (cytosine-5-)-methyltransferase n=1 Tax=Pseudolysobacter antarcticus TaxID=2511995 RepID=A0A411HK65_9GAMM|nr:DNA cytosine methyltransferase [Pseudolysobacter antarcticus]QBB70871.1 DNA cytosine methyltransferase [Pseudolysobacter antarcticus]